MTGQALVGEIRLESSESEVDRTQKSNEEACNNRKAGNWKSDPQNGSKKHLNKTGTDKDFQEILYGSKKCSNNADTIAYETIDNSSSSAADGPTDIRNDKRGLKKSITVEHMLGLREEPEWRESEEETDILKGTFALFTTKHDERPKHYAPTCGKAEVKDKKKARLDRHYVSNAPNEEASMSYTLKHPITPVVLIDGNEIVLKIPIQIEKHKTECQNSLAQPSQEVKYRQGSRKKIPPKNNCVPQFKSHSCTTASTHLKDYDRNMLISREVPQNKYHHKQHNKHTKAKRIKLRRRSESAPCGLVIPVQKGDPHANGARTSRCLCGGKKVSTISNDTLQMKQLKDEKGFISDRRCRLSGRSVPTQKQRFTYEMHPNGAFQRPVHEVQRRSAQNRRRLYGVRGGHKQAIRSGANVMQ